MGSHAHGSLAAKIVSTSIQRDIKQHSTVAKDGIHAMISRASWVLDTIE